MALTRKDELLTQQIKAWLEPAMRFHPDIRGELSHVIELYNVGAYAWSQAPFQRFLTSYAQLRDWAEISCDPIEEWIYGNLLPKHGSFAAAFDRQLKPDSILSRQLVMDWFEALQVSGEALCKMVEFIVLRKAAGLDVDKTQIDLLAKLFNRASATKGTSCPPLADFLGITKDPAGVDSSLQEVSVAVSASGVQHQSPKSRGTKRKRQTATQETPSSSQAISSRKKKARRQYARSPSPTAQPTIPTGVSVSVPLRQPLDENQKMHVRTLLQKIEDRVEDCKRDVKEVVQNMHVAAISDGLEAFISR